ncbi:hypothetical protein Sste5346_008118 [Sporothrix stenoceras]|uniref:Uncharacterized protein n=1 Tax=Sporothrix stenoceras TaxID=5173 RepID=A0ABR3YRT4_9PEZI
MRSPMTTAVVQSSILHAISNVVAQLITAYQSRGEPEKAHSTSLIDIAQLARFVIFALLTAPMNYKFQQLLEYAFPGHGNRPAREHRYTPGRKRTDDLERQDEKRRPSPHHLHWGNVFAKWFLDCLSLGTVLNTTAFLIIMGVLKGQSASQIEANLRNELARIVVTGYRVWPIASIVSFTLVPLERRITWLSLVGLLWGVYMSIVAARV